MPDPDASRDNVQHMTIRPQRDDDGAGDGAGGKPRKLTYADMVDRWVARGYPKASAQGIADNMMRESGGDPSVVGDGGTSRGLFQHHDTRADELAAYAKKRGKSADDPDVQIDFADQEMKTKFPTLQKQLMAGTDRAAAEDSFKRIFERPASIMWQNSPPKLGSDRFRFSDYALDEHRDRPNTDVMMMSPQDYLDLSPDLEGSPFKSPSGRSLVKSVNNGDEIESIPSLKVRQHGNTATVTDQDGRHRALLAQQEGLDAIPVAVHKTGGEGGAEPTEIQGMSGTILPHPTTKAASVPRSFWQGVGDALIPRAEAAEAPKNAVKLDGDPFADDEPKPQPKNAVKIEGNPFADGGQAEPDGMVVSALKGASAGAGNAIFGGQELLGKGLQAVSGDGMIGRTGNWLVNDAREREAAEAQKTAADHAAHPLATGLGGLAGNLAMQLLLTKGKGGFGGNALLRAATGGALGGALEPVGTDDGYWISKALQSGLGAVVGTALSMGLHAAAGWIATNINTPAYEFVSRLVGGNIGKNKAALKIVDRMATDERAGGATAQDMLDLINAAPDKPQVLGDVADEGVRGYMGRLSRTPGESRTIIKKGLNDRDAGAPSRVAGDVDGAISSGSVDDAGDALNALKKNRSRPLYATAYAKPPINPDHMAPDGVIGSLLNTPSVKKALHRAMEIAAEERIDLTADGIDLDPQGVPFFTKVPTWRALDYVKRGLDDVVEKYRNQITGRLELDTLGRASQDTRTLFRNALRRLNPEYAEALDSYSGPSASVGAMKAGQGFLNRRPAEIARRMSDLSPADREFFKMGVADTLRIRLAKNGLRAIRRMASTTSNRDTYMRDRIRAVFSDNGEYERFMASIDTEGRMAGLRDDVSGNSRSADRLAEDHSPEADVASHGLRSAANFAHGNWLGAASNAVRALRPLNSLRNPAIDADAARILMTPLNDGATRARLNGLGLGLSDPRYARAHGVSNFIKDRLDQLAGPRNALAAGLRHPSVAATGGSLAAGIPSMVVRPGDDQ